MQASQIEAKHQRIDIIVRSMKEAERFVDHQAYCDVEGEKKLYTLEQLNNLLAKEEDELRGMAQQ